MKSFTVKDFEERSNENHFWYLWSFHAINIIKEEVALLVRIRIQEFFLKRLFKNPNSTTANGELEREISFFLKSYI